MAALRWFNEGWGDEVTTIDVIDAFDPALAAAERARLDNVLAQLRTQLDRRRVPGTRSSGSPWRAGYDEAEREGSADSRPV
jgi:hypothetical protein